MSSTHPDASSAADGDTGHDGAFSIGGHKASYDDLNVPVIVTVGFVSTILTVVAIFGVQGLYYGYARSELTRKVYETTRTPQTEIVAEQKAKLETYSHEVRKLESEDGPSESTSIAIPIAEVIPQVLEQQKKAQESEFGSSSE